jgi:uncharacterized membrane protein YdjX (TVP38/TMEM64 family)
MKDARLLASLTAAGRVLRRKPRTYGQAWLLAALVGTIPSVVVYCILGASNAWHKPWPALVAGYLALIFVIQGLTQSHHVHRRRKIAREMSTSD